MSGLVRPVDERDHVLGPAAATTLLEYGDYECAACGAAYPEVERVRRVLGERVRFAFRHFPLTQAHPHAMAAAEAAEAAGALGDFWGMHHRLYRHQHRLEREDLRGYALRLRLDLAAFTDQLDRHVHRDRIREDFRGGIRSGVNGTPTFFIDGERYDGPWAADDLLAAIAAVASA